MSHEPPDPFEGSGPTHRFDFLCDCPWCSRERQLMEQARQQRAFEAMQQLPGPHNIDCLCRLCRLCKEQRQREAFERWQAIRNLSRDLSQPAAKPTGSHPVLLVDYDGTKTRIDADVLTPEIRRASRAMFPTSVAMLDQVYVRTEEIDPDRQATIYREVRWLTRDNAQIAGMVLIRSHYRAPDGLFGMIRAFDAVHVQIEWEPLVRQLELMPTSLIPWEAVRARHIELAV